MVLGFNKVSAIQIIALCYLSSKSKGKYGYNAIDGRAGKHNLHISCPVTYKLLSSTMECRFLTCKTSF